MLDRTGLGELARTLATMVDARSPSEVFQALLRGSGRAAPRVAVFLFHQGSIRGWGAKGYSAEAVERLRGLTVRSRGWLGRLAQDAAVRTDRPRTGEAAPDFGQPLSAESMAFPVRVGGRTVAIVLAERDREELNWRPELMESLATVAGLRLDLDLLRRKTGAAPKAAEARQPAATAPATEPRAGTPAGPTGGMTGVADDFVAETRAAVEEASGPPEAPPEEAPEEPPALTVEVEAAAIDEAAEPEQPTGLAEPAAEDPKQVSSARRYARLIATDIRLYNEEAVMLGRRHRDLVARLGEHLERGRETFARRYGELGDEGLEILRDAYVQVLAAGDDELISGGRQGD